MKLSEWSNYQVTLLLVERSAQHSTGSHGGRMFAGLYNRARLIVCHCGVCQSKTKIGEQLSQAKSLFEISSDLQSWMHVHGGP